jgi:hypothetical protein
LTILIKFIIQIIVSAPVLVCHVENTWDGANTVKEQINEIAQNYHTVCFVSDRDSVPLTRCDEIYTAPAGMTSYNINYPFAFICGGYRKACFKNFVESLQEDNPSVFLIPINGCIY